VVEPKITIRLLASNTVPSFRVAVARLLQAADYTVPRTASTRLEFNAVAQRKIIPVIDDDPQMLGAREHRRMEGLQARRAKAA
jgi:hypothetical protein